MSNGDQIRNFDLQQLLSLNSRFLRQYALYALTAEADEETLQELLRRSNEIESSRLRHQIEATVIRKWATISPKNALVQIQGVPEVRFLDLVRTVFREWCIADADAAIEYAQQNMDLASRQAVGEAILQSRRDLSRSQMLAIAQKLEIESHIVKMIDKELIEAPVLDAESAWETFIEEHRNSLVFLIGDQAELLEKIADSYVEQHGLEAFDAINKTIPNFDDKDVMLSKVLRRIAREDPAAAFEIALSQPRREELGLITVAVAEWARIDPLAALDRISNVAADGDRVSYQGIVLRSWISSEGSLAVLRKLERIPSDIRELAEGLAISASARTSPEQSIVWMQKIEDPTRKARITKSIAATWARNDPEAALEWVLSDPSVEDLRDQVASTALRELARSNRELALTRALSLTRKDSDVGFEADVIRTVARRDIEGALTLLPHARNEETKLAGLHFIGASLMRIYDVEGADRAVKLADELGSDELRTQYFESLLPIWVFVNPRDLYNRIDQFPLEELKASAAILLLERDKENLSSEQVDDT